MELLPNEIFFEFFKKLTMKDISVLSNTSKNMYFLCNSYNTQLNSKIKNFYFIKWFLFEINRSINCYYLPAKISFLANINLQSLKSYGSTFIFRSGKIKVEVKFSNYLEDISMFFKSSNNQPTKYKINFDKKSCKLIFLCEKNYSRLDEVVFFYPQSFPKFL